jgi:two-component system response regulator FixJ
VREEPVVYVVDDEESVRSSLAFLLSASGYTVKTYASASTFLADAESIENGCLITDLRMPDMDGFELLRQLRMADAMLPAVVMTGHGDVQSAIEAITHGALDFLEKPFSQDALFGAIRRALEASAAPVPAEEVHRRLSLLDEQEQRVIRRLVSGESAKSIAVEIGSDVSSVSKCSLEIMAKMQADGLPALIRLWVCARPAADTD